MRWGLAAAGTLFALMDASGALGACDTGGKIVFEDRFDTLASTWGKADAELFVENGRLVMKPKANFTLWAPNTAGVVMAVSFTRTNRVQTMAANRYRR